MNQDERWLQMWRQYMDFLATHGRRPSKYVGAERELVNWQKHNRKLLNQGRLRAVRHAPLVQLLTEACRLQRVNQHQYANGEATWPGKGEGGAFTGKLDFGV